MKENFPLPFLCGCFNCAILIDPHALFAKRKLQYSQQSLAISTKQFACVISALCNLMDTRWLSNGMHVCEVSMSSEKLEVEKTESILQNSPIAFCDSCASLVLINFSPASRTRQTHAKHEPGLHCFLALGDKSNGNSM